LKTLSLDDWESYWLKGDTTNTVSDPNADTDLDSLDNLGEYQNNTWPTDPDTDDDGYLDGIEVLRGSDPLDSCSICGDINRSGSINLLDILYLINYLYKDGNSPIIPDMVDVNNSGSIDIMDAVYLINYLYKSGPEPNCI